MTTHIERLIHQLDDSTGPSYDARAELIYIGSDAIPAIIDGLPSLDRFGQLTAIEVFEEVADPRCGPALTALLHSDDSTVREWAAMALASLKIDGVVEPVRRAYRACLERATPPDWSEPEGIRWALTKLDARTPVVPPLTARLQAATADDAPGWPTAHLTEIINDLADHAQVILYSQFWQVNAGRTYGVSGPVLDWELVWTAPWEHLVEESRTLVPTGSLRSPAGDNIFVAPPGSTGPTCTRRGDRCCPSTPPKLATATWSRAT
ncbi:HEAT repeat domain-containing protein [Streptomyces sp. NPDC047981]|uniref:HEAT repeat domain-containing protein n=1 Tax=Streptomyces sp. NPDC047981 TaxID=3154610 RepID=UPI00342B1FC0